MELMDDTKFQTYILFIIFLIKNENELVKIRLSNRSKIKNENTDLFTINKFKRNIYN